MAPEDTPREEDPRKLERLRLAEQEAERLAALMGPEWAAGMYE